MLSMLEGIKEYCSSDYDDYVRTLSFQVYLKRGEKHFDIFFQNFGRNARQISLDTLDILKNELIKDAFIENIPIY